MSNCDWGAVPPTCGVMPAKWQQRLMCATDGVFTQPSGICHGLGGLEPLDTATPPQAFVVGKVQHGSLFVFFRRLAKRCYAAQTLGATTMVRATSQRRISG